LIFCLLLFPYLTLPTSAFPFVHIVGSLTFKFPSIKNHFVFTCLTWKQCHYRDFFLFLHQEQPVMLPFTSQRSFHCEFSVPKPFLLCRFHGVFTLLKFVAHAQSTSRMSISSVFVTWPTGTCMNTSPHCVVGNVIIRCSRMMQENSVMANYKMLGSAVCNRFFGIATHVYIYI
jgi:hypothetical protein